MRGVSNTWNTTLRTAYVAGGTTLAVVSATGAPTVPFGVKVDSEFFNVTAVTTGASPALTVSGAQEGSTAAAHRSGVAVRNLLTAQDIRDLQDSTVLLAHEEFVPPATASSISLSHVSDVVLTVSRNGLVQSADAGHYSVVGATITFSTVFAASERVVVAYSHSADQSLLVAGMPVGAISVGLPPRRRSRSRDYSILHTHTTTV